MKKILGFIGLFVTAGSANAGLIGDDIFASNQFNAVTPVSAVIVSVIEFDYQDSGQK